MYIAFESGEFFFFFISNVSNIEDIIPLIVHYFYMICIASLIFLQSFKVPTTY